MPPKAIRPRKRGRKNITTACTLCRQSKIKCDGTTPKCGNCESRDLECVYETGKDKRRLALRQIVEVCAERINQLEVYIYSLDEDVPQPLSNDSATLLNEVKYSFIHKLEPYDSNHDSPADLATSCVTEVVENSQLPEQRGLSRSEPSETFAADPPISTTTETDVGNLYTSPGFVPPTSFGDVDDNFEWLQSLNEVDENAMVQPLSDIQSSSEVNQDENTNLSHVFPTIYEPSDDESDAEIIEQLSIRMGGLRVIDDGTLRFLGPTSNRTLVPSSSFYNPATRNMQTTLNPLRLKDFLKDPDFQHLLKLYFCWENSFLPLIDQQIFEEDLEKLNSGEMVFFCSESLKFSIAALGTILDANISTYVSKSTAELLADHAITLLMRECDHPNVATVQSFAVLSCLEGIRTRDARGWLYAGMATRLALDLGLHTDTAALILSQQMTEATSRARKVAFWGSYLNDQLWCLYLGRPLGHQAYETFLSNPIADRLQTAHFWTPYPNRIDTQHESSQSYPSPHITVFLHSFVKICQEISTLASKLYGSVRSSNDELVDEAEIAFNNLQRWKGSLPTLLKLDMSTSLSDKAANILLLHIQYFVFIIVLHRPFASRSATQPFPPRGKGPFHAREMCITAAVDIAKLLRQYENSFGFSNIATPAVHAAFSAALILVYTTVSSTAISVPGDRSEDLATCCRVLSTLGGRFESATRALDTLLAVKRDWQSSLLVGSRRKRSNSDRQGSGQGTFRKKTRNERFRTDSFITTDGSEDDILQQLVEFPALGGNFGALIMPQ